MIWPVMDAISCAGCATEFVAYLPVDGKVFSIIAERDRPVRTRSDSESERDGDSKRSGVDSPHPSFYIMCVAEPMDVYLAARIKALRDEADTLQRVLDDYCLKQMGLPPGSPAVPRPHREDRARVVLDTLLPHRRDFGTFVVPDQSGGGRPIARGSNTYRTLEWLHWAGPKGLTINDIYELHSAHGYDNQAGVRNVIFKQGKLGRIVKKGDIFFAAAHASQT